ncbi:MAG: flagellar motor switch protein FliM [Gammaproteobacteria bacterium]|nr:flagellar motor switch protein FliM [Gammaproteobacteria bacterium]
MSNKENESVLTEEESQALLERTAGGASPVATSDPGAVTELDVTHWDRIVRGRVPALEAVNERLATAMQISLFKVLRREVTVTGEPVRMEKWVEYSESLPRPTSLCIARSEDQDTNFLVAMDADLLFELVDAYFGGPGGAKRKGDVSEFTPTELRVSRSTIDRVLNDMQDAWSVFRAMNFVAERLESNPQFAAIAAPADPVYVSRFRMELNGHGGEFHVVLPSAMVDPVRHLVNVGSPRERDKNKDYWNAALHDDVRNASVTLRTVLAETNICLGDLLSMQEGDVIPIDLPEMAKVYAGDSPVLAGKFGVSNGRNAIKVIHATGESFDKGRAMS